MRDAISNFIGLNPQNIIEPIYWVLILGWIVFVAATVQSVLSQPMGAFGKFCWTAIVIFAPGIGIFLYLLYCLFAADYGFLERFGLAGGRPKK